MKLKSFLVPVTLILFFSYYVVGDHLHRYLHHLQDTHHSHQVRCLASTLTALADDEDSPSKTKEVGQSKCALSKSLQNITRNFKQKDFFSFDKMASPIAENISPDPNKDLFKKLLSLTNAPSTGPPITSTSF